MNLKREKLNSENIGLAWDFCVSPNSCDNPYYYSEYITLCAMADCNIGKSVTHLFIDSDCNALAGYISLRATSLISDNEDGAPVVHPAIEIAELAVSKNYEHRGIGTEMFNFAALIADRLRIDTIGIKYIAVCADPRAIGFYKTLGFSPVRDLYRIPRDGWNEDCEPMYIELPDLR